jgi:hypothetical protein
MVGFNRKKLLRSNPIESNQKKIREQIFKKKRERERIKP